MCWPPDAVPLPGDMAVGTLADSLLDVEKGISGVARSISWASAGLLCSGCSCCLSSISLFTYVPLAYDYVQCVCLDVHRLIGCCWPCDLMDALSLNIAELPDS
ncbi:hypothetical protein Nepgr_021646 [Nepenthes gracilis]|uniref:Uncharacterized protein n=1 Tax=Nepenthes gracilis TaxID=150966 RepID=A0AAD3SXU7_NEPGR|nr:hypothetical protein Nepgr_021646 [Nepenthes gracilis]